MTMACVEHDVLSGNSKLVVDAGANIALEVIRDRSNFANGDDIHRNDHKRSIFAFKD